MNPDHFDYILTAADRTEAIKAALRQARRQRGFTRKKLVVWSILIVAVILCSFLSRDPSTAAIPTTAPSPATTADALRILASWLGVWIIVFAVAGVFLFPRLRKIRKTDEEMQEPCTLAVGDGGLTITAPFVRTEIQWEAFYGSETTKNLFLLYTTNPKTGRVVQFQIVPKRAFASPEQAAEFQRLVKIKIRPRTSPRTSRLQVDLPRPVLPP